MTVRAMAVFASVGMLAGCTNGSNPDGSFGISNDLIGSGPFGLHPVLAANPKIAGASSANFLPPELIETPVAQGAIPVENPATVTLADGSTTTVTHYGYDGDGTLLPAPGDLPSATHLVEASKTEPDKNTYLALFGQTGADPTYDYGTHFLFQGHESGTTGYITRINLDADAAHRVTIMASKDRTGAALDAIDGSIWDPFAQRLLFTAEDSGGPEYQATLGFPSLVEDISGSIGRGGYERIQNDSAGNVWIVEDVGGAVATATPHAKTPNSFIFRFVPRRSDDLTRGKLRRCRSPPCVRASRSHSTRPTSTRCPPTSAACTPTARSSTPNGSRCTTPTSTATRPSTPTRWPRPSWRRPSSARRTACSAPASGSRSSTSPRPVIRPR